GTGARSCTAGTDAAGTATHTRAGARTRTAGTGATGTTAAYADAGADTRAACVRTRAYACRGTRSPGSHADTCAGGRTCGTDAGPCTDADLGKPIIGQQTHGQKRHERPYDAAMWRHERLPSG